MPTGRHLSMLLKNVWTPSARPRSPPTPGARMESQSGSNPYRPYLYKHVLWANLFVFDPRLQPAGEAEPLLFSVAANKVTVSSREYFPRLFREVTDTEQHEAAVARYQEWCARNENKIPRLRIQAEYSSSRGSQDALKRALGNGFLP